MSTEISACGPSDGVGLAVAVGVGVGLGGVGDGVGGTVAVGEGVVTGGVGVTLAPGVGDTQLPLSVVMVNSHPPMLPKSPPASSKT